MKSLTENQTERRTSYLVKKIHNWNFIGEQLLVKVDCLVISSYEQDVDYQLMIKDTLLLNKSETIEGEFTYKIPHPITEFINNIHDEGVYFIYLNDDIILIFDFKIFEI